MVDTLGLIVAPVVHPANVQDRDGGRLLVQQPGTCFDRLQLIVADGGCAGKFVDRVGGRYGSVATIVERHAAGRFVVPPKRWIVERTFARLGTCRRLSRDYETLVDCSKATILMAMPNTMPRRLSSG